MTFSLNYKLFIQPVIGSKGLKGLANLLEYMDIYGYFELAEIPLSYMKQQLKFCNYKLLEENGLACNNNFIIPLNYIRLTREQWEKADSWLKRYDFIDIVKMFTLYVKDENVTNLYNVNITKFLENWIRTRINPKTKALLKKKVETKVEENNVFNVFTNAYRVHTKVVYKADMYDLTKIGSFCSSNSELNIEQYFVESFKYAKERNLTPTVSLITSNNWRNQIVPRLNGKQQEVQWV